MLNHDVTDQAYSLLRYYLGAYENLKSEKRAQEKERKIPKLFVPPIAPSRSHRDIRGYRLCYNIGAVEFYRSTGSHEKIASAGYLRTLPSVAALAKGWTSSFEAIERFQDQRITRGESTKFRVTVLGVRGAHLPESFTTNFVATWIGQGIRDKFGWTVDLENHDIEVVATVLMSATGLRTVGVLSLGLTLCRASYTETMAGLLANQPSKLLEDKQFNLEHLSKPRSFTEASGTYVVRQMLNIAEKLQEPRASWCLVRRAVKSDQFRRKFLNATNKRGETPLILAAKACETRLVSLILQLGKQKVKEAKLPPHLNGHPMTRFRPIRSDLLRQDSRKYDALMYSCEKGDNSTLSILLQHKTGSFNWGFNKLCERLLTVATTACQPHSLNFLLHHVATTKGLAPLPSLCWPALRAAVLMGHSLTIALILDYMRILADKHLTQTKTTVKVKSKEKDACHDVPQRSPSRAPISQDIVTALLSKALPASSHFPTAPSSLSYPPLSAIHLLLRADACVSGGNNNEEIPLLNFLPDDMKSEVKILRFGSCSSSDGKQTWASRDIKEDEFDTDPECKPQPKNKLFYDLDVDVDLEKNLFAEKGKEKEKDKTKLGLSSSSLPTKQKRTRVLGRGLLPFQLYEQEKQVWLAALLSTFQTSSFLLCSSTIQLVLNYLVV